MNRAPLIALATVAVGPYLLVLALHEWSVHENLTAGHGNWNGLETINDAFFSGSAMSLICGSLVAAALGGNAFATEKRERWADFLAMMPVSRWKIALSKLLVSLGSMSVFWTVNLIVFAAAGYGQFYENHPNKALIRMLAEPAVSMICMGLAMFSIAWFVSVFLNSAAISACIAIAVLLTLSTAIGTSITPSPSWRAEDVIKVVTLGAGIAMLIAGGIVYLRRVAP